MKHLIQTAFKTDPNDNTWSPVDDSITINGYRFVPISERAFWRFVKALDTDEIRHYTSSISAYQDSKERFVRLLHHDLIFDKPKNTGALDPIAALRTNQPPHAAPA